jgi:hypothetical protein
MDRRQKTWSLIVLVPAMVSTALFVYGFVAWTGWASLTDWNQMRGSPASCRRTVIGLDNYEAIFDTPRFWTNDVFNNVVFTAFVVGAVVAGAPAGHPHRPAHPRRGEAAASSSCRWRSIRGHGTIWAGSSTRATASRAIEGIAIDGAHASSRRLPAAGLGLLDGASTSCAGPHR